MTDYDMSAGGKTVEAAPSEEIVALKEHFSSVIVALESRVLAVELHLIGQTGFAAVDPLAPVVPVIPVEG